MPDYLFKVIDKTMEVQVTYYYLKQKSSNHENTIRYRRYVYIYIYITVSAEWDLKYYKCIPLFQLQHLYSTCQDKGLFLQRKKNQSTIGEKILSESCECLVFGVCRGIWHMHSLGKNFLNANT